MGLTANKIAFFACCLISALVYNGLFIIFFFIFIIFGWIRGVKFKSQSKIIGSLIYKGFIIEVGGYYFYTIFILFLYHCIYFCIIFIPFLYHFKYFVAFRFTLCRIYAIIVYLLYNFHPLFNFPSLLIHFSYNSNCKIIQFPVSFHSIFVVFSISVYFHSIFM